MLGGVSSDIPAQDPQSVKQVSSSSLSDVSQPCPSEMQAAGVGRDTGEQLTFSALHSPASLVTVITKGLLSIR